MKNYVSLTSCLLLVLYACAMLTAASLHGDDQDVKKVEAAIDDVPNSKLISVDAIGKSVKLVGRLGKPIGTFTNVEGQWFRYLHEKQGRRIFIVMAVDGTPLAHPLGFDNVSFEVKPALADEEGTIWQLRCFENVTFTGLPENYRKESTLPSAAGIQPWHFQSSLHAVKVEVYKPKTAANLKP